MSDGISAMYDDYDDYELLCNKYKEKQLPMYGFAGKIGGKGKNWYEHFCELEARAKKEQQR